MRKNRGVNISPHACFILLLLQLPLCLVGVSHSRAASGPDEIDSEKSSNVVDGSDIVQRREFDLDPSITGDSQVIFVDHARRRRTTFRSITPAPTYKTKSVPNFVGVAVDWIVRLITPTPSIMANDDDTKSLIAQYIGQMVNIDKDGIVVSLRAISGVTNQVECKVSFRVPPRRTPDFVTVLNGKELVGFPGTTVDVVDTPFFKVFETSGEDMTQSFGSLFQEEGSGNNSNLTVVGKVKVRLPVGDANDPRLEGGIRRALSKQVAKVGGVATQSVVIEKTPVQDTEGFIVQYTVVSPNIKLLAADVDESNDQGVLPSSSVSVLFNSTEIHYERSGEEVVVQDAIEMEDPLFVLARLEGEVVLAATDPAGFARHPKVRECVRKAIGKSIQQYHAVAELGLSEGVKQAEATIMRMYSDDDAVVDGFNVLVSFDAFMVMTTQKEITSTDVKARIRAQIIDALDENVLPFSTLCLQHHHINDLYAVTTAQVVAPVTYLYHYGYLGGGFTPDSTTISNATSREILLVGDINVTVNSLLALQAMTPSDNNSVLVQSVSTSLVFDAQQCHIINFLSNRTIVQANFWYACLLSREEVAKRAPSLFELADHVEERLNRYFANRLTNLLTCPQLTTSVVNLTVGKAVLTDVTLQRTDFGNTTQTIIKAVVPAKSAPLPTGNLSSIM